MKTYAKRVVIVALCTIGAIETITLALDSYLYYKGEKIIKCEFIKGKLK